MLIALLSARAAAAQATSLVGDWTGESICVGEPGACHDEQVIYHLSVAKSDAQKFTMAADKIVDGKPQPMGEQDFSYDATNHILTAEFQTARYHLRIEYTVKDRMMWGTMMVLPERRVVRQMRVTKSDSSQPTAKMSTHATGTFEVKLVPVEDKSIDPSIGRMAGDKQWSGDLVGASKVEMLSGGDPKTGSAGYVAMEKFTGSVKGRKGSFLFQHSATMIAGHGDLNIIVVPGTGTDELKGISGTLTIKIENGKHFYDFEYSIN